MLKTTKRENKNDRHEGGDIEGVGGDINGLSRK